jgi:hypothetical protein
MAGQSEDASRREVIDVTLRFRHVRGTTDYADYADGIRVTLTSLFLQDTWIQGFEDSQNCHRATEAGRNAASR